MPSIKIKSQRQDDYTEIKLLIAHPMENGRNRHPETGALIPAHFIKELIVKLNDTPVINVDLAGSIAKNPFFTFRLKTVASGDKITASWTDNQQLSDSVDHIVN